MKIAIAVSEFNHLITDKLLQGALDEAENQGITTPFVVKVPGAVELPFAAQQLAKTKKYDAIVLLGCVIRGQTDHYDYVCQQVSQGTQQVMMHYDLPVIFGVLTTHDKEQALARSGGERGNKGAYAVNAAIEMARLQADLRVGKMYRYSAS
ncbi:6,7-dimethyl-8-ribityllumazine synthase [Facilibium subflavum]|uniref:6,7-dimethyl-8-ribityllumazine synthase n=1 Tax=Facilibium subflavum TaxID=2219058 RepID=UPI000E65DEA4|nr:6,7-dimethyl-8-ribityllumazine synthase [Facilibium subflavum]